MGENCGNYSYFWSQNNFSTIFNSRSPNSSMEKYKLAYIKQYLLRKTLKALWGNDIHTPQESRKTTY